MNIITGSKLSTYLKEQLSAAEMEWVSALDSNKPISAEMIYEGRKLDLIEVGELSINPFNFKIEEGKPVHILNVKINSNNAELLNYNPHTSTLIHRTINSTDEVFIHFNYDKNETTLSNVVIKQANAFKKHVGRLNTAIEKFNSDLKTLIFEELVKKVAEKEAIAKELAIHGILVK